jgi:hypothetical protein
MANNEQQLKWLRALRKKGHTPILNEDDKTHDFFALNQGIHNGPGCSKCGENWCWHCQGPDEIIPCKMGK